MLHIDPTASLAKVITPSAGIPDQEFLAMAQTMRRVVTDVKNESLHGSHAWLQDPYNDDVIFRIKEIAKRMKDERVQTVLWIGIGGSGLGPRVLQEVFETPDTVELIVLDTIDPSTLEMYARILDWKTTMLVVVSKSGNTLESMSAFHYFWRDMKRVRGGKAKDFTIAVTDPDTGPLHDFALDQGIEILPIPTAVGGRYSIFTPVGLLPLALLGGDLDAFIEGARDMEVSIQNENLEENPAALLAGMQFLLDTKRGYLMRVIMPYSNRLQSLARWNQQLIAESLGKNEVVNPFPVAAIGTQDQHSLLQQWMQGPKKCWHLFIKEIEKPRVTVPKDIGAPFDFIAGKSFGQVLDAFLEGTSRGLTAAKRAHITLSVTRIDEYHLGQMFLCFLAEAVFLGKLYRIDPYGQPGVEMSKTIAKDILTHGRPE